MKKIILLLVAFMLFGITIKAQEKIFYIAKSVSNYYTIFSINPDGTDKVQIFDDTWHRSGVNITAEGEMYYLKREYFDLTLGGQTLLCKSNLDGTNETTLWTYPDGATLLLRGYMDLRSDKQKILYSTYKEPERNGDVFELDLTTFTSTNISNNNDYPPQGIARYSTDLSKILYIELATNWYAYPWNMFLINSDGTNRTEITPDTHESFYFPDFSNDGTKIIYCSYTGLTTPMSLFIANSDGTNGQQVIPTMGGSDGIWCPTFSPDDSKIIFYRAGNLVISLPDGTILSEFPVETIEDQSNIIWAKVNNFSISFNNQSTNVGNTIEIPVNTTELTVNDSIISYLFDFNYDNTKLEYLGNSLVGTLAENGNLTVNPTTNNLSIAWADVNPIIGEGSLIKLQFNVLDAGTITPTITNALFNTIAVSSISNGIITSTYPVNAGVDTSICQSSIDLHADPSYGMWTVVGGSGIFVAPTMYNTTVFNIGEGENVFRWTVDGVFSDDVVITNNQISLCGNASDPLCNGNYSISFQEIPNAIGEWSTISGTGIIADNTSNITSVSDVGTGENIFQWNVNNAGCLISEQIVITKDTSDSQTYYFEGTAPSVPNGIWSPICVTGGTYVDPTLYNTFFINLPQNETSTFRWTIFKNVCSTDNILSIYYVPQVASAGIDSTICQNSIDLHAEPSYGMWTVLGGSGIFANTTMYNTTVFNIGEGENVFRWTLSGGEFDDVIITNSSPSDAIITWPMGDYEQTCNGTSSLEAIDPLMIGPGTGEWSLISGDGIIENINTYQTIVNNLAVGNNTFRWTITNGICSSFDEIIITNNQVTANAGIDTTFWSYVVPSPSVGIQLYADEPQIGFVGTWTSNNPNDVFVSPSLYNTLATNLHPGMHHFTWTVTNGICSAADNVDIMARIKIINKNGVTGNWNNISTWEPEVIPTDYDSVEIINGNITVEGDTGKFYNLKLRNNASLSVKANIDGNSGVLRGGKVVIEQDVEKKSPSEKSAPKSISNLFIYNGGQLIIDQDPDGILTEAEIGIEMIGGGSCLVEQNISQTEPAINIKKGFGLYVENKLSPRSGGLTIKGGRLFISQTAEKGLSELNSSKTLMRPVKIGSGGRLFISQTAEKGLSEIISSKAGLTSELNAPSIQITGGILILGDELGGNISQCVIKSGHVVIEQDIENPEYVSELRVGSNGIIEFFDNTEIKDSYMEIGNNSAVTFTYNASVTVPSTTIPAITLEGTASLIDENPDGATTGVVQINQILPQNNKLFTSPIPGITASFYQNSEIYSWNETDFSWNLLGATDEIAAAKGYLSYSLNPITVSYSGNFYTGTQTFALSNTASGDINSQGWNFAGNPFTSSIDWDNLILNGIENTVYIYNPEKENFMLYQQGGISLNGADRFIAITEGMFVKANSESVNPVLELGNTSKTHEIKGLYLPTEYKSYSDEIKLFVSGNGFSDETLIAFSNDALPTFESNKDIFKLFSLSENVPQLYTKLTSLENLAVNITEFPDVKTIIPLNFNPGIGGIFQISFPEFTLNTEYDVYLYDSQNDLSFNMRTIPIYEFTASSTDSEERFEIILGKGLSQIENNLVDNVSPILYSYEDKIYIKIFTDETYKMSIYNTLGQNVYETFTKGIGSKTIEPNLLEGMYFVEIQSKLTKHTFKIFMK